MFAPFCHERQITDSDKTKVAFTPTSAATLAFPHLRHDHHERVHDDGTSCRRDASAAPHARSDSSQARCTSEREIDAHEHAASDAARATAAAATTCTAVIVLHQRKDNSKCSKEDEALDASSSQKRRRQ